VNWLFFADQVVSRVKPFVDMDAEVVWCWAVPFGGLVLCFSDVFRLRRALPDCSEGKEGDECSVDEVHLVALD
jgi:hypothetical protein